MCLLGPIEAFSTACGRGAVGACSRGAARSFPHSPLVVSGRRPGGGLGPHARLGAGASRSSWPPGRAWCRTTASGRLTGMGATVPWPVSWSVSGGHVSQSVRPSMPVPRLAQRCPLSRWASPRVSAPWAHHASPSPVCSCVRQRMSPENPPCRDDSYTRPQHAWLPMQGSSRIGAFHARRGTLPASRGTSVVARPTVPPDVPPSLRPVARAADRPEAPWSVHCHGPRRGTRARRPRPPGARPGTAAHRRPLASSPHSAGTTWCCRRLPRTPQPVLA
jgi:hypothetical protein